MSRHYRAVARIFGTNAAVSHVRQAMTLAEAENPGYEFSIKPLKMHTGSFELHGLELRGSASNGAPGFTQAHLAVITSVSKTIIVECVIDDEDHETVQVYQAGHLLYETRRQEATGDIYEIGQGGVDYVYVGEQGTRDIFLLSMTAAGVVHDLTPL